ncbi:MAG: ABC-2 family transporter protein [Candidatus Nanoarchaeia archaeon]|nr:ABC-2 family transporter protein [Candidatus Nanoarchaeia archaeon]
MIKKFLASLKIGLKSAVIYRFHFYVGLVTAPLTLLIYYYLWKSIYGFSGQTIINGFSFELLVSYYAINTIVAWIVYSEVDEWFERNILNGELTVDLIIPIHLFPYYFLIHQGFNIFCLVVETLPFLFIATMVFNIQLPGVGMILAFIVGLLLALLLNFMIAYLVGLGAFWLKRITGMRRAKNTIVMFLAGGILPLSFFPIWFQKISEFLPFQYIRNSIINIWLYPQSLVELLKIYFMQLFWIGIFWLIISFVWKKASKKFSGVGV